MLSYRPHSFRKSLFFVTLFYLTANAYSPYSQEQTAIPDTSTRRYSKKYYEQFLNPEMLSGMPKDTWYGDNGTKNEGKLYPVYDVTGDWNAKGFSDSSICEIFRIAKKASRRPKKILERYNSGRETLILLHGGDLSPLEKEAMGEFSFYVQRADSGKAILRVKDIYDPERSGFGKIERFIPGIGKKKAKKLFEQRAGNGSPYRMEGEWIIDESLIFKTFSGPSSKKSPSSSPGQSGGS